MLDRRRFLATAGASFLAAPGAPHARPARRVARLALAAKVIE